MPRCLGPTTILHKTMQPLLRRLAASQLRPAQFRTSVLRNGLTVASEHMPGTQTATVGMWINAGSRADQPESSGTAHFLEHLAFKGTRKRTQHGLELEIENLGSQINAYTLRENTVYYTRCLGRDLGRNVDILSDLLTQLRLDKLAIEKERAVILQESDEVDKMFDEVVFDHLHEIVYPGQDLGRTILGPRAKIRTISRDDLVSYIRTNYKGDRMALVGVGSVDHDELVRVAERHFGHIAPGSASQFDVPVFCGAERRIQQDLPVTHVVLAVEGVSWSAPDFFTLSVANGIIGSWDRSIGIGSDSPSPLAVFAQGRGQPVANLYMAYTTLYADSGLMGVYFTADSDTDMLRFVNAVLAEWARLKAGNVSEDEVERSKAQLKALLLLALDDSLAIAEDIGRQLVNTGFRLSPEEVFARVEAITKEDVVNWANFRLKDKPIAMCALGNCTTLPLHEALVAGMR